MDGLAYHMHAGLEFDACIAQHISWEWESAIFTNSSRLLSPECIHFVQLSVILLQQLSKMTLYIFLHCTVCITSLPVAVTQIISSNCIHVDTTEGIFPTFVDLFRSITLKPWCHNRNHLIRFRHQELGLLELKQINRKSDKPHE